MIMKYIGIDIGATNLRLGIFDESMSMLKAIKIIKPSIHSEDSLANIILDNLAKEVDPNEIRGIGIGAAGLLDLDNGDVSFSSNINVHRVRLVKPIISKLHVPVLLLNDAVAAAYGEYMLEHNDVDDLVYLSIGTGIGAGVIIDGEPLLGKNGNAHEVGCIVIAPDSNLRCGCGGLGHWEALASGINLPRSLIDYAMKNKSLYINKSSLLNRILSNAIITAADIYNEAYNDDALAVDFLDFISRINAAGLASIINLFDPQVVVLGGSVILNNVNYWINGIKKYLDIYLAPHKYELRVSRYGDAAVMIGAATAIIKPTPKMRKLMDKYLAMYL